MRIWCVAIHKMLTGDSWVELYGTEAEAKTRWKSMYDIDKSACADSEDNWREDIDGLCREYWYDTGDETCTVRLTSQNVPIGGENE